MRGHRLEPPVTVGSPHLGVADVEADGGEPQSSPSRRPRRRETNIEIGTRAWYGDSRLPLPVPDC